MCAGTGKVRDYTPELSPFGAGTYFTIDPEKLGDILFTEAIYGT